MSKDKGKFKLFVKFFHTSEEEKKKALFEIFDILLSKKKHENETDKNKRRIS